MRQIVNGRKSLSVYHTIEFTPKRRAARAGESYLPATAIAPTSVGDDDYLKSDLEFRHCAPRYPARDYSRELG